MEQQGVNLQRGGNRDALSIRSRHQLPWSFVRESSNLDYLRYLRDIYFPSEVKQSAARVAIAFVATKWAIDTSMAKLADFPRRTASGLPPK